MATMTLPKADNQYTLGSTAKMMRDFAQKDLNIPASLDRPTSLDLAITNAQAASLTKRIHELDILTRGLSKQQNISADMLARMGQNPETERAASTYLQRQMPLTDKTNGLLAEKEALKKMVNGFIKVQHEKLKNAFANPSAIHETLDELDRAKTDILNRIKKLDINANSLKGQLANFTEEVRKIMIAAGVSPDGITPTYGN